MVATVLATAVGLGGYKLYQRVLPYFYGTGCTVEVPAGQARLTVEQAANAATIAAVGMSEGLPRRAVTIALATAIQESHLRNLHYGDRDSVGLFQQRPSQGWGTVEEILDPVYAASQFYEALVEVDNYLELPLHVAAQEVQRSADGTAYAKHEDKASKLSMALTGNQPGGLRCWYPPEERAAAQPDDAQDALRHTFDLQLDERSVEVSSTDLGWTVSSWAVAHAREFGIASVSYAGHTWSHESGHEGWEPTGSADGASAHAATTSSSVRVHYVSQQH